LQQIVDAGGGESLPTKQLRRRPGDFLPGPFPFCGHDFSPSLKNQPSGLFSQKGNDCQDHKTILPIKQGKALAFP
jgi:hypothetical protein